MIFGSCLAVVLLVTIIVVKRRRQTPLAQADQIAA
jgi:hypothetical protein